MKPNSPLESVYFITLPEGFELSKNAMHIDPTIPLPVQKKDKDAPGQFNPEELTAEQILAGLLTVLAYDRTNTHLDYYRSVLKEARPDIKKELSEAAILKAKNEDYEIAEEMFMALQGFDPEDKVITLNMALFFDQRADSYRRSGLIDDADAYDDNALYYYKEAMLAEPPIADAFFNAGFYYLKQNDFFNAKEAFETYVTLTCDIKDEELGDNGIYKRDRAQEILNKISNQNMDDERFKAAYDLISNGEEEKGLEQIRLFLEKNPNVWNAWFMLGWGLRRITRYTDAIAAFEKALEYGGDTNSDTYNEMAICYLEMNDLSKAKDSLMKALSIDPESTKIISNLGYLALKEGNVSEAQKYFATVLTIDPDDKIALHELGKLEQ
ncbi:MAG: tetratricopeptide repeat protein [Treponema sp.]|nr:tetratricopeptide repeat protein [Candidatus Treponema scatequi]